MYARGPVSEPEDGVGDEGEASRAWPVAAEAPKIVSNTLSTTPCERGGAGAATGSAGRTAAAAVAVAAGSVFARLEAAIVELTSEDAAAAPDAAGALDVQDVQEEADALVALAAGVDVQVACEGRASAAALGTSVAVSTPGGGAIDFEVAADAVTGLPAGFLAAAAAVAAGFGVAAVAFRALAVTAAVSGAVSALRAASARARVNAFDCCIIFMFEMWRCVGSIAADCPAALASKIAGSTIAL